MVGPSAKRVLVIAHYFPPLAMGGVQRIAKFCKYLPRHGWEPLVIASASRSYFALDTSMEDELKGTEVFRAPSLLPMAFGTGESFERWRGRLKVLASWCLVPDTRVLWAPRALLLGRRVLSRSRVDCILATAPPFSSLIVARLLALWTGLPLAVDLRDAWVDDPFALFPTPMHRLANVMLERFVVSGSKKIISINREIMERLRKRHKAEDARFRIVNQGFDPEDFEQSVLKSGKFTICYAGSLVRTRRPDDLFRAVSELLDEGALERERLEVDIVGFTPVAFRKLAERLGIGDVVAFRGYLPHAESVRHLIKADALWLYIAESEGETVVTGKVYEYIGSGRWIVASVPENGAAASLIRDTGSGETLRPGDVESLKKALAAAYRKWLAGEELSGGSGVAENYDRRRLTAELADILTEISR